MSKDDKNSSEYMQMMMWVVPLCIAIFIVGVWMLFHAQISSFIRWYRFSQMWLIDWVVDNEAMDAVRTAVGRVPANLIEPSDLLTMSHFPLYYLRLGMLPLMVLMIGYLAIFHNPYKFRRRFTMQSLIEAQSRAFLGLKPLIKFNPVKDLKSRGPGDPVPAKLPLFAEALTPAEWIAFHGIPMVKGKPDHPTMVRAFSKQLGPRWRGPEKLPLYLQALFACMAWKANGKRKESDKLLSEIASCWSPKRGLRLSADLKKQIKKIIKDPKYGGVLTKTAANHAFVTTAFLGCLQHARNMGGVMAPAQFLWMRGVNRAVWYPLNNLGRRAYHCEAAGAMAHFKAEKMSVRPIPNAKVEAAATGILSYIDYIGGAIDVPAKVQ